MNPKTELQLIENKTARHAEFDKCDPNFLDREAMKTIRNFHKQFKEYEPTPLYSLKTLAKALGVSEIWVKDESKRFGLNAFKVLGGAYAIGKYLAQKLNKDISELSFEWLTSEGVKKELGDLTFVTATDGNHGRGIAWAAKQLGQKSVVFMPKGSSEIRLRRIIEEGAEAQITDLNYDDAVRLANQYAEEHNGVFIQDSSWDGYMEIPTWIMEGYATIMDEVYEAFEGQDHKAQEKGTPFTHVFLQAGVGSFAGSMLGYLTSFLGEKRPLVTIVEPNEAACIFKSMKIADGKPHAVTGFMPTIMAGLACGEPSLVAWNLLRDYADFYIACDDCFTVKGMQVLGNPLEGDPKIISGESGAVGLGVLVEIIKKPVYNDIVQQMALNAHSKILIISTEGDTDPENYNRILGI